MPEDEEREGGREVSRYDGKVIYMHWAVVIVFISLVLISLLLFRDWYWETFNIRGTDPLVQTPGWGADLHLVLAALLLLLGLVHVALHVRQEEKPILPYDVMEDFRASVHTLKYVFFLSRWDEKSGAEKYRGNQRMSYMITFYVVALAALTGMVAAWVLTEEAWVTIHVVAGLMVVLVFVYRMVYIFRKRDWIAWRSVFINGRMPVWYVKQNHPKWYEEMEAPSAGTVERERMEEPPSEPEEQPGREAPEGPGTPAGNDTADTGPSKPEAGPTAGSASQ